MSDIEIRPARASDAEQLAPLLTQLGYPSTPAQMKRRLPELLARDEYALFVAEQSAKLLGAGAVHVIPAIHDDRPFALIAAMVVDESVRGAGLGRRLVAALEAWAESRNCERIIVTSANHRAGAHAFYQQIGYAATGLRFGRPLA